MDKKRNILLAKKYMVDSIYRSANIEGIAMTFPETQTICDGMSVANHSIDEVNAICDLKRAWEWIFDNLDKEIDLDTVKKINRAVGKFTVVNAGSIRTMFDEPIRVTLREGYYYPPVPDSPSRLEAEIKELLTTKDGTNRALELFCYIAKKQLFADGNKRTATLVCNFSMIKDGCGILSIPPEKKLEFYDVLTDYYADEAKKGALICFLKEHCITCEKEYTTGEKLTMLRERMGLDRDEVAGRLRIPVERLFLLERGEATLEVDELKAVSSLYGIAPEVLEEEKKNEELELG